MILRPFFWNELCDNYIEAIKYRFYEEDKATKTAALKNALNLFYKMLSIFSFIMPYITEEIYHVIFKTFVGLDSVHQSKWPQSYPKINEKKVKQGEVAIKLIQNLRKNKSELQIPLNQELERVIVFVKNDNKVQDIEDLKEDISNTIRINSLEVQKQSEKAAIKDKPTLKDEYKDINIEIFLYQ
jgi:valyl-tRNA synthetase